MSNRLLFIVFLFLLPLLALHSTAAAQKLQNKLLSFEVQQQPLSRVLTLMSEQGGFVFSYQGSQLPGDSLVSLSIHQQTVKTVINRLLGPGARLTESGNYLVIQFTALPATYTASGYVYDNKGLPLPDASVYDPQQLVAGFTNSQGYFALSLKTRYAKATLHISKIGYSDTAITLQSGNEQPVQARLQTATGELAPVTVTAGVDQSWLSRLFTSSGQKKLSRNVRNFFAYRPFQLSLTPGLSTHGSLSGLVINKLSLNIIGGYTAGANGFEAGGLFNIDKRQVHGVQLAGGFNVDGQSLTGLQAAGLHNQVHDTVRGVQIAGYMNKAEGSVQGVQLAVICNYARRLKGLQIGLVNITDSLGGFSLGLVNVVAGGYSKLSVYASDLMNTNVSYKSGNAKLYSILLAGANLAPNARVYAFGWGLGHDFMVSSAVRFSLIADYQVIAMASFDNRLAQARADINVQLGKRWSLFGGASFNSYDNQENHSPGYKDIAPGSGHKSWIGWQAGITADMQSTATHTTRRNVSDAGNWLLETNLQEGLIYDDPYTTSTGGALLLQKSFGRVAAVADAGYLHFFQKADVPQGPMQDLVPVKAGLRILAGKNFYAGADAGYAFGLSGSRGSFTWSPSLGFRFNPGIHFGLAYETFGDTRLRKIDQLTLRLGYAFPVFR